MDSFLKNGKQSDLGSNFRASQSLSLNRFQFQKIQVNSSQECNSTFMECKKKETMMEEPIHRKPFPVPLQQQDKDDHYKEQR